MELKRTVGTSPSNIECFSLAALMAPDWLIFVVLIERVQRTRQRRPWWTRRIQTRYLCMLCCLLADFLINSWFRVEDAEQGGRGGFGGGR